MDLLLGENIKPYCTIKDADYIGDFAVAPGGEIYVADTFNHRLLLCTPLGETIRCIEGPGKDAGKLHYPTGVALAGGRLYVADSYNNRVLVFSQEGEFLFIFGEPGAKKGFIEPYSLTSTETQIFIADRGSDRILKACLDGYNLSSVSGSGLIFRFPVSLEVHKNGCLYVLNSRKPFFLIINPDESLRISIGLNPASGSWVPTCFALVGDCLFFANPCTDKLKIYTANGFYAGFLKLPYIPGALKNCNEKLFFTTSGNLLSYLEAPVLSESEMIKHFLSNETLSEEYSQENRELGWEIIGRYHITQKEWEKAALSFRQTSSFQISSKENTSIINTLWHNGFREDSLQLVKGCLSFEPKNKEYHRFLVKSQKDKENARLKREINLIIKQKCLEEKFCLEKAGSLGRIKSPNQVGFDSEGSYWITDTGNNRLIKMDCFNNSLLSINNIPGREGFYPVSVFVNKEDNIFVSDWANQIIAVFNKKGEFLFTAGADLKNAWILGYGEDGVISVCDTSIGKILNFSDDGIFLGEAKKLCLEGQSVAPVSMINNRFGVKWFIDRSKNRIIKQSNNTLESCGVPGSGPGRFTYPYAMAKDREGCIYVTDIKNGNLQKFSKDFQFIYELKFSPNAQPAGIAIFDKQLIALDFNNSLICGFQIN